MTYRLNSLHLGTDFDPPVARLEVPGELTTGRSSVITMVEGFQRGGAVVGRANARDPLIGIRLDVPDRPLALTVVLGLAAGSRELSMEQHAEDPALPDVPHRLVALSLQGQVCAAAQFVAGDERLRERLTTVLRPDMLEEGGMLLLELHDLDPGSARGWPSPLRDGASGLMIVVVRVREVPDQLVQLSSGVLRPPQLPRRAVLMSQSPGTVVLNPVAPGEEATIRFVPRRGPVPKGRIQALDRSGALVVDELIEADPHGRLDALMPTDRGPLLVRCTEPERGGQWSVHRDFRVSVPRGRA